MNVQQLETNPRNLRRDPCRTVPDGRRWHVLKPCAPRLVTATYACLAFIYCLGNGGPYDMEGFHKCLHPLNVLAKAYV